MVTQKSFCDTCHGSWEIQISEGVTLTAFHCINISPNHLQQKRRIFRRPLSANNKRPPSLFRDKGDDAALPSLPRDVSVCTGRERARHHHGGLEVLRFHFLQDLSFDPHPGPESTEKSTEKKHLRFCDMSKLPIFLTFFLVVGNLKWKLKWFFSRFFWLIFFLLN